MHDSDQTAEQSEVSREEKVRGPWVTPKVINSEVTANTKSFFRTGSDRSIYS